MRFASPQFVSVDGRRLAYEEVAPPDPAGTVLLLCGMGDKRQGWFKQLPALAQRFRTVTVDYRDVGDSDPADGPYAITDLADDVAAMSHELGIDRASLVAVSMGGFIALRLALEHPEFVERLIVGATSAGGASHVPPSPQILQALLPDDEDYAKGTSARRLCSVVAGPGFVEHESAVIEEFAEIVRHNPMHRDAYWRQLAACRDHDVAERLSEIRAPTLVIHGEVDPLMPIENGRLLAKRIPGARLLVYEGVGHIPQLECAERFNRDLLGFLE